MHTSNVVIVVVCTLMCIKVVLAMNFYDFQCSQVLELFSVNSGNQSYVSKNFNIKKMHLKLVFFSFYFLIIMKNMASRNQNSLTLNDFKRIFSI